MTRLEAPIGQREDQRTEFKRAEALRRLEPISHAVVSMLNASGGNVWIGVIEQDERWQGVEPIENADREARRLQDHLVSAIEPSPHDGEVSVEPFSLTEGQILVTRVSKGRRRPYAFVKSGGRHFDLRVGGRSRPMTHSELVEAFGKSSESEDELLVASEEAWKAALETGHRFLWVRIAHEPPLALPRDRSTNETLTDYLQHPTSTENRQMGYSFASGYARFELKRGVFSAGGPEAPTWIDVEESGTIVFRAPLPRLTVDAANEIYPHALVEFPVSVARLARALHRAFDGDVDGQVVLDVGLIGARGMRLRPCWPGSLPYEIDHETQEIEDDPIRPAPYVQPVSALLDAPDAVAWRVVTALYFAIGFLPDRMPLDVYDERLRRVHFPR